ncbi:MAG TPA: hypothetical protein VND62_09890 [Acidimicrobiales bacterium]|nr:hypothetical protein [Acidimicrobiales bacterium]
MTADVETAGTPTGEDEAGHPAHGADRAVTPAPHTPGSARRAQAVAVTSLAALPLLVYALPALLGHPVVPGDDLTQNLPLRELVGNDLRAGALPTFDPYVWSGAPLLAGWNAGAAYPLTWLFALVPGAAAWTVNLVAASAVAALGTYAFLRASRLGVLASWAGAMTFGFGGGMVAQVPHVGLVIGMSWVPLALLALLRLTEPPDAHSVRARLRWTAVLAAAVGLVLLAGEPRAVTDGATILLLYGAWRVVRLAAISRTLGALAGGATLAGAVLGAGLGAVQLVPGLAAVATSQRAHVSAFLFGAGTLPLRWLTLLGVPDLLGGSGSFGQPVYFATYNLTEITGYVGLLPLAAAVALFARRRRRTLPEWLIWEVAAAAGVLLALGNHTPLWRFLIHVPLIGGQRLQSRGILVADLALAVLLAYWLDGWLRSPRRSSRSLAGGSSGSSGARAEVVLGTLPVLAVAGVAAWAWVGGASLLRWMGVTTDTAAHAAAVRPWLVPPLVLAAAAVALVVGGARLTPTGRGAAAGAFVVVDLFVFSATAVVAVDPSFGSGVAPGALTSPVPHTATLGWRSAPAARIRPIRTLHLSGRFAVYDPALLDAAQLSELGVPDANTLAGTWSIQGYGSIVDGHYAAATGVHGVSGTGQNVFSPRAAAGGTFDSLSTSAVLAPSDYLRAPPRGANATVPAGDGPGTRRLAAGGRTTWFLGSPIDVRAAHLALRAAAGNRSVPVGRVGLLTETGRVLWAQVQPAGAGRTGASSASSRWHATWPSATDAVALVVESRDPMIASPPVVTDAAGHAEVLAGALQQAILAPHWRYAGQDGPFTVFVDRRARPPLSLHALPGTTLGRATVRRLSGPALAPTDALVSSPRGADVVRAVAALPGWTASWTAASTRGRSAHPRPLTVHRTGVVQSVRAPAGRGVLSWRYTAPGLLLGEVLSMAALAVLVALLVVASRYGTRRASP